MEFANAIIAFTGISFLVYGFNSLTSKRMINEFERWKFSKHRKLISVLQILGAIGLFLGLKFNLILIASSLGLSIMMFFAIIVRIKIKPVIFCITSFTTPIFKKNMENKIARNEIINEYPYL